MKWFWADIHFESEKIAGLRGFDSLEKWQKTAIDALNLFVDRQDALYLLGDFASNRPGYWREKINCRHVYLIRGNHEPGAKKLQNVFGGNVWDIKEVKVHGVRTILCHYPMMFWNRSHIDSYHLYGHIHCSQPREAFMDLAGDRRSMDVSPEASRKYLGGMRPFSETDVHSILSTRRGHEVNTPK